MMDTSALYQKGLRLRREMLGQEAVEARMNAVGTFGEPLQHIINAYAYGDVWSRPALPPATKSLAMIAMMAAAARANELAVHVRGALANGATAEQIQDILLLVPCIAASPPRTRRTGSRPKCSRTPDRARPPPARADHDMDGRVFSGSFGRRAGRSARCIGLVPPPGAHSTGSRRVRSAKSAPAPPCGPARTCLPADCLVAAGFVWPDPRPLMARQVRRCGRV
jgi:4-carboxymuconolactone decarboxylase